MRALMKKRKEQGVSDLEAGVSQSWKNAQARRDRAFDKRFNDEWNRYRSAGWKRYIPIFLVHIVTGKEVDRA